MRSSLKLPRESSERKFYEVKNIIDYVIFTLISLSYMSLHIIFNLFPKYYVYKKTLFCWCQITNTLEPTTYLTTYRTFLRSLKTLSLACLTTCEIKIHLQQTKHFNFVAE